MRGRRLPGQAEGDLPSAQRCFGRRSPNEGPANREPMPRGQGETVWGEYGGGQVATRSISPSPEGTEPVGTSISDFLATLLTARRSLSLSSLVHVAPLEACLASHPGHPWMDRHPSTHRDHPQGPVQDHERNEKKESRKPYRRDLRY
jgi:hypothetical protein